MQIGGFGPLSFAFRTCSKSDGRHNACQSGHTYSDLLAYCKRHLAGIFGTTIRLKIDINVLTIYINIKAGDRGICISGIMASVNLP